MDLGIYPAIDPLLSSSSLLAPHIVGQDHYDIAMQVKATLARYEDLQDVIAILGMDELSEKDQKPSFALGEFNASSHSPCMPLRSILVIPVNSSP